MRIEVQGRMWCVRVRPPVFKSHSLFFVDSADIDAIYHRSGPFATRSRCLLQLRRLVDFSITASIMNYDYTSCSLLLLSAVRDIVAIRFLSPNARDVASRSLYPESMAICSIRKRISFL